MTKTKTPPIRTDDVLMTIKEVALLDQTSARTTRRAIKAGLLEVLRVGPKGHMIRVTREAYASYRQRLTRRF